MSPTASCGASSTTRRSASSSSACSRNRRPPPAAPGPACPRARARGRPRSSAARCRSRRPCSTSRSAATTRSRPPARRDGGPAGGQHDMSPQKVAEMAANLAARLEKEPDNAEGWLILAHTYYSLKRFPEAIGAYEHAAKLLPNDANMLADYADALGAATNSLEGKPTELINRALKADPTQWKALALAGTVAFNHKDYKQAVVYWEQLKTTLPPESDMARSIDVEHRRGEGAGRHQDRRRARTRGRACRQARRGERCTRRRHGAGDVRIRGERDAWQRDQRHHHAESDLCQGRRAGGYGLHRRARGARPEVSARDHQEAGQGSALQVLARRFDGDVARNEDVEFRRHRRRGARDEIRRTRRRKAATSKARRSRSSSAPTASPW